MNMRKFVESLDGVERSDLKIVLDSYLSINQFMPNAEELALWKISTKKIDAIGAFRNRTGLGLKDSKDVFDKLTFDKSKVVDQEILPCPEFESPPKMM